MDEKWVIKHLIAVPVEDVMKPITGRVARVDYWWLEKDGCVYRAKSFGTYQCNRDRRIVETVYGKLIKESGFTARHIPVAYVEARQ